MSPAASWSSERRLPNAGLPADEDDRARHEAAAEHPVDLADAR